MNKRTFVRREASHPHPPPRRYVVFVLFSYFSCSLSSLSSPIVAIVSSPLLSFPCLTTFRSACAVNKHFCWICHSHLASICVFFPPPAVLHPLSWWGDWQRRKELASIPILAQSRYRGLAASPGGDGCAVNAEQQLALSWGHKAADLLFQGNNVGRLLWEKVWAFCTDTCRKHTNPILLVQTAALSV